MINLFSKLKSPILQSSDHYLHGKIVTEYEEKFADYVGAKYACSANSETSLIFILFDKLVNDQDFIIPSILPPVVANSLINGGNTISFRDDVNWVGKDYEIDDNVWDSAHRVDKNQYKEHPNSVMLFSNYPTKPVGGIDGGVIVSDDKYLIEYIRCLIYNGTNATQKNSWDRKQITVGWKMYMSTIQAEVALYSLNNLEIKKERLGEIREKYNNSFSLDNTSDHLYRVKVDDNKQVLEKLKGKGIICGTHYQPLHTISLFNSYRTDVGKNFPLSDKVGKTTLSIPFHEDLSDSEIEQVINEVGPYVI